MGRAPELMLFRSCSDSRAGRRVCAHQNAMDAGFVRQMKRPGQAVMHTKMVRLFQAIDAPQ